MDFNSWLESQDKFMLMVYLFMILVAIVLFGRPLGGTTRLFALVLLVASVFLIINYYKVKSEEIVAINTNFYKRLRRIAERVCPTKLKGRLLEMVLPNGLGSMNIGTITGYVKIKCHDLADAMHKVNHERTRKGLRELSESGSFHVVMYSVPGGMPFVTDKKLVVFHDSQIINGLRPTINKVMVEGESLVPCGDFDLVTSSVDLSPYFTATMKSFVNNQMEHGIMEALGGIVSKAINADSSHSKIMQRNSSLPGNIFGVGK